jgi:hypothetical protein
MFEKEKREIDFALDTLAMKAYDAGWNSVLDLINEAITEKHMAQDKIAVEVIVWLRNKIAGEDA